MVIFSISVMTYLDLSKCYFKGTPVILKKYCSEVLSSTTLKIFYFHSLRLDLWMPCWVQQLFTQEFSLRYNIFKVYGNTLSIIWSFCETLPRLAVIYNLLISCQYLCMVFIYKRWVCTITLKLGINFLNLNTFDRTLSCM